MDLELNDKRVLVSGSSRGIGRAVAERFLDEGARVVFTSRGSEDLEAISRKFPSEKVMTQVCDFVSDDQVRQLLATVAETWGGLDVAVANVGSGKSVPDPVPEPGHFKEMIDINLTSAINLARHALPLLQQSGGNMVVIGSIAGLEVFGAPTAYAAAKTALTSFAANLSYVSARTGVRVNCVAPGNIYFEDGTWGRKQRENPRAVQQMLEEKVPMQRFGRPREVADAVVFLASERAAFITGTTLRVDGGQTAGMF
ncbi:MAG: SDR family NAD(P)-dependent oxidoreductase [Acidobacteriota bacterium]|nr:SDR family NAD(P)-dependent oxidoreductase [Acidobacteriota bacterium]